MATLLSGLPDIVANDESIARFLTSSGHYNRTMAKPSAFLPNPEDQETSTSRHGSEPLGDLWALGVAAAGARKLHGAAICLAADIRAALLLIEADEPPPRHAAIRGWPWDSNDPELQRAAQKERAMQLASKSALVLMS